MPFDLALSRRAVLAGLGASGMFPVNGQAGGDDLAYTDFDLNGWAGDALMAAAAAAPNTNIVLGSYTLHAALALLSLGADDATLVKLGASSLLGVNGRPDGRRKRDEVIKAYGGFAKRLAPVDGDPTVINTGSGIWLPQGTKLTEATATSAKAMFANLETQDVDFAQAAAADGINAFIEKATAGKITRLIDKTSKDTNIVIVDAIYFKGLWVTPFEPAETKPADFQAAGGATKQVPTMHATVDGAYAEDDTFRLAALPYGTDRVSRSVLYILQAKKPSDSLDATKLNFAVVRARLTPGIKPAQLAIAMPRFKAAFKDDVTKLVTSGNLAFFADGSGKFDKLTGGDVGQLKVVRGAMIEVDVRGSEAAAATGVIGTRSAVIKSAPVPFKVDRPFAFAVSVSGPGRD